MKALLKRSGQDRPAGQVLEANGVKVDLERVSVQVEGNDMQLPKKEFELLVLLMSKPGKVFKREEIYSQIWGNELYVGERTIDVQPAGQRQVLSRGGTLAAPRAFSLEAPANALPGSEAGRALLQRRHALGPCGRDS